MNFNFLISTLACCLLFYASTTAKNSTIYPPFKSCGSKGAFLTSLTFEPKCSNKSCVFYEGENVTVEAIGMMTVTANNPTIVLSFKPVGAHPMGYIDVSTETICNKKKFNMTCPLVNHTMFYAHRRLQLMQSMTPSMVDARVRVYEGTKVDVCFEGRVDVEIRM